MEIEFTDEAGKPSGRSLYLAIALQDSPPTPADRAYWQAQLYPVLLVYPNAEGEVRWRPHNGEEERFDVMSVRRWRDKILPAGIP